MIIKKRNFIIIAASNIVNNSIPTLIFVLLAFDGLWTDSSNLALISSFVILFCQFLSAHRKNIILSDDNLKMAHNVFNYRIFCSIFIIIFSFLIFINFISKTLIFASFLLILIIATQWLIEILLVVLEIRKKFIYLYFYFTGVIVISIFVIYNLLFSIFNLNLTLLIYFIFNLTFITFSIARKNIRIQNIDTNKIFFQNLSDSSFFSSVSIYIGSFSWKFFIVLLIGSSNAAGLISAFAISSFAVSSFNSAYGLTIIKNKVNFAIVVLLYFILVFFLIYFLFFNIDINNSAFKNLNYTQYEIFYKSLIISLPSSIMMLIAQNFRLTSFHVRKKERVHIYKTDMFYSTLVILIIPVLFLIFGQKGLYFSFLLSSIISLLIYYPLTNFKS